MPSLAEMFKSGGGSTNNPFIRPPRTRQTGGVDDEYDPSRGDPYFSQTRAGTQEQYPVAAADYNLASSQRQATKLSALLDSMGVTVPANVQQVAQQGYLPEAPSTFEKTLGVLDAPRRVVNFALQDIFGGAEERTGFNSPDIGDYWDAFLGHDLDVSLRTGHTPSSGSELLALWGWETPEGTDPGSMAGRGLRGTMDFLLQVFTDPLTYVTFGASALGKKALAESGEAAIRRVTKDALEGVGTTALHKKLATEFAEQSDQIYRGLLDGTDDVSRQALELGLDDALEIELRQQAAAQAEEQLLRNARDEVITPIISRNFSHLPEEWLPELPKFAQGGMRLTINPFTAKGLSRGVIVPGTRGLGRQIADNSVRRMLGVAKGFPVFHNLAKPLRQGLNKRLGVDNALLSAVRAGTLSGGEYMLIRDGLEHDLLKWKAGEITSNLDFFQSNIIRTAKDSLGMPDEHLKGLLRSVFQYVTTPTDELVLRIGGKDLAIDAGSPMYQAVTEFGEFARKALDDAYGALAKVAKEFDVGYLKNYLPQTMSKKGLDFIRELSGSQAIVKHLEILAKSENGAGAFYVAKLLDAIGYGGRLVEGAVGSNARELTRKVGLSPVVSMYDDAFTVLFDPQVMNMHGVPGVLKTLTATVGPDRYIDTVKLNDLMEGVFQDLATKFNVPIPEGGARLFNENPFEVISDYMKTVNNTVMYRNLINTLEANGLILAKPRFIDMQETLNQIAVKLAKPKYMKIAEQAENLRRLKEVDPPGYELELARRSGRMLKLGETIRSELSRTSRAGASAGFYDRLVIKPHTPKSRERFLPEIVAGARKKKAGRPLEIIYDVQSNTFTTKPPDVNPQAWVDRAADGRVMILRLRQGDNSVDVWHKTGASVNSLTNAVFNRRALEFAHANGFENVFTHSTSKPGPAIGQTVRDVVLELDDVEAYSDAYQRVRRVTQTGDLLEDGEIEALQREKVGAGFRRVLKRNRESYDKYDDGMNRFFGLKNAEPADARDVEIAQEILAAEGQHPLVGSASRYTKFNRDQFAFVYQGGDPIVATEGARKGGLTVDRLYSEGFMRSFQYKGSVDLGNPQGMMHVWRWEQLPTKVQDALIEGHGTIDYLRDLPPLPKPVMSYEASRSLERIAMSDIGSTTGAVVLPWQGKWHSELVRGGEKRAAAAERLAKKLGIPTARTKDLIEGELLENGERYSQLIHGNVEGDTFKWYTADWRAADLDLDELEKAGLWLSRRLGLKRLERLTGGITTDLSTELSVRADQFVDISKLDDETLYTALRDLVNNNVEMASVASAGGKRGWAGKILAREYTRMYGLEFVASARKTAKEIVQAENDVVGFAETLGHMFGYARQANGQLAPTTEFLSTFDSPFARYVRDAKKYAKHLGIDPDTFDVAVTGVRSDYKLPNGRSFVDPSLFNVGGGALENKLVQADIAVWFEQLVKNMGAIYTPQGIAVLKATTNQVLKWWKGMVTITRPTFHIRNLIGGIWNNQIVGVSLGDYARVNTNMLRLRGALRNGKNLDTAINALPEGSRAMFRDAWNSGLLDYSFSSAEFRALSQAERSAISKRIGLVNPFDVENFLLARKGALFMEGIEDFLRMSAFAAWWKPGQARVAKEMSLGVHFDYKHLTEFETRIKRFVPFYVWSRRNIPLQVATLIERPGIMNRYSHLMNAAQSEFPGVEQDDYPGSPFWSASAVGTDIVLNENTPFWARLMFDPDLPVRDLSDLTSADNPGEFMQYFLDMLGPQYSVLQDFIEQKDFGDVNAPAPFSWVMSQMARGGFFDTSADGDIQMPYFMRTIHNLLFPWSREYEDILFPSEPKRQQALGLTEQEPQGDVSNILTRLGLTLGKGVGIQTQTPSQSAGPARESSDLINELVGKYIKQGTFTAEQYTDFGR